MTVCGRYRLLTRGAAPWWIGKIFRRIYRRHHLYAILVFFPPYPLALCTGRKRAVAVRLSAGANGNPARGRGGGVACVRGGVAGGSTCPLAARWRVTPARGMGTTRAWSRASREQAGAARGTRRRQWVPRAPRPCAPRDPAAICFFLEPREVSVWSTSLRERGVCAFYFLFAGAHRRASSSSWGIAWQLSAQSNLLIPLRFYDSLRKGLTTRNGKRIVVAVPG